MADLVVHRHFDKMGRLLYVGQTQDEKKRKYQHKTVSPWRNDIETVTTDHYGTRREALAAEAKAIAEESPLYNSTATRKWKLAGKRDALQEAQAFHAQFITPGAHSMDDLRAALRKACEAVGSVKEWAWRYGFTYQYIAVVLNGSRPLSHDMLKLFRAKQQTLYFMKD